MELPDPDGQAGIGQWTKHHAGREGPEDMGDDTRSRAKLKQHQEGVGEPGEPNKINSTFLEFSEWDYFYLYAFSMKDLYHKIWKVYFNRIKCVFYWFSSVQMLTNAALKCEVDFFPLILTQSIWYLFLAACNDYLLYRDSNKW